MPDETDAKPDGVIEAERELSAEDVRARDDHARIDSAPAIPPAAALSADPSLAGRGLRGGQVVLTGDAQAAARGELHGTIEHNTAARDAAVKL